MTTYLKPNYDNAKSFYNKATVTDNGGALILRSYETDVCKVEQGRFVRLWGGYSRTTMRHVNEFRFTLGFPALTASEWRALPVG